MLFIETRKNDRLVLKRSLILSPCEPLRRSFCQIRYSIVDLGYVSWLCRVAGSLLKIYLIAKEKQLPVPLILRRTHEVPQRKTKWPERILCFEVARDPWSELQKPQNIIVQGFIWFLKTTRKRETSRRKQGSWALKVPIVFVFITKKGIV